MPEHDYDIHPELAEQSNIYRELVRAGEEFGSMGIDPGTAAVILAAVPITLRILKMINAFVSASLDDWKEGRRLKRKREELELDREFNQKK